MINVFIFSSIALAVGLGYWIWRSKIRVFNVCEFYTPMSEAGILKSDYVYRFIGKKEVKNGEKWVKYKEDTFPVDWSKPAIFSTRKTIFCFDIQNKIQVQFMGGGCSSGRTDIHDLVLGTSIMSKFLRGVANIDRLTLMIILLMSVLCVMACVIGYAMYPIINPVVSNVPVVPAGV